MCTPVKVADFHVCDFGFMCALPHHFCYKDACDLENQLYRMWRG